MPGRIPDTVLDEINQGNNIVEIAKKHVDLIQKGGKWWGLCPFHTEKTPSFTVTPGHNLYYCFGCQRGGGIFQLLMELEGLSFREAVEQLAQQAGIRISDSHTGTDELLDNRQVLVDLYSRVSRALNWVLLNKPEASIARNYLGQRGIDLKTAKRFEIGWSPSGKTWLWDFLVSKNYSPSLLEESGLFSKKKKKISLFINRVMFPVMRDEERVLAFSGRRLGEQGPKYINTPETVFFKKSRELYGWGQAKKAIRKTGKVILCEGAMDVLACAQAGIENTVAPLGTAFGNEQARLIQRQADTLVLLFDADEAGMNATKKAALLGEEVNLRVCTAELPENRDPADILIEKGSEFLRKITNNTTNVYDFLLNFYISAKIDLTGSEKEKILGDLSPYLLSIDSDIRREEYLKKLADAINIDYTTIIREFNRYNNNFIESGQSGTSLSSYNDEYLNDEVYLLTAVAIHGKYYSLLREQLPPEMIRNSTALSLYRILDDFYCRDQTYHLESVLAQIDNPDLRKQIILAATNHIFESRVEETVRDIIMRLKIRVYNEEKKQLLGHLGKKESNKFSGLTDARLQRIKELDEEILKYKKT